MSGTRNSRKPNIIVIVSDTLRTRELGCYGSRDVATPNIDALAQRSVRFTRAFPESLPTIPVRRALHTGRRAYPFRGYAPVKWDIVYLPGWQPMDNAEDTVAEALAEAGYHTGFVSDTIPYFSPGMNFTRGFRQWEFVRGQQNDRWRSPFVVTEEALAPYVRPWAAQGAVYDNVRMHLANTARFKSEEDTCTAKVFEWAVEFVEDNRDQPFYLFVDCFDPHEPWEAPEKYLRMYGDSDFKGRRIINCRYGPVSEFGYTPEEVANAVANYKGLVSLVDTWLGKLIGRVDALGLSENTAIVLVSDHGTNFCDNPRGVIGKPENAMYPGVMRVPLMVRLPGEPGAGTACDELVYNLDVTATVSDIAGLPSGDGLSGQSLRPLVEGRDGWTGRDYVTCRYNNSVVCVDDRTWALGDVRGNVQEVFDLERDHDCMHDIAAGAADRWRIACERLLADAGGELPDYAVRNATDAVGQKV